MASVGDLFHRGLTLAAHDCGGKSAHASVTLGAGTREVLRSPPIGAFSWLEGRPYTRGCSSTRSGEVGMKRPRLTLSLFNPRRRLRDRLLAAMLVGRPGTRRRLLRAHRGRSARHHPEHRRRGRQRPRRATRRVRSRPTSRRPPPPTSTAACRRSRPRWTPSPAHGRRHPQGRHAQPVAGQPAGSGALRQPGGHGKPGGPDAGRRPLAVHTPGEEIGDGVYEIPVGLVRRAPSCWSGSTGTNQGVAARAAPL